MGRARAGGHGGTARGVLPALAVAAAAAVTLSACSTPGARRGQGTAPTSTTAATGPAGARDRAVSLVSYGGCGALLSQLKQEALAEVGPYGLSPAGPVLHGGPVRAALGAVAPAPEAAASAGTGAAGTAGTSTASPASGGFSTTNDQEAGVDEPDLVKTDGRLMVVLRQDPAGIEVVDVTTPSPHLDGFLPLPQTAGATGLFLVGSDAIVIGDQQAVPQVYGAGGAVSSGALEAGNGEGGPIVPEPAQGAETTVTVVSLADPGHPRVVRTTSLGGQEIDARLTGGTVFVATQGTPVLPFVSPRDDTGAAAQDALARNRSVIRTSTLADWLPPVRAGASGAAQLPACPDVMHPVVASGVGTVSVVPIDPGTGAAGQQVTVVGSGSVLYASTANMYLATTSWADQSGSAQGRVAPATTDIHAFSLAGGVPHYVGSGSVPGTLTGQYAMSEYDGVLRVATTVGQAYAPGPAVGANGAEAQGSAPGSGDAQAAPSDPGASDNLVTDLQPAGGALVPVGQVSGLGRGERIYGVRFVGSLGYVVTFRQTDPLYVVDLSDPRHPALRGALELPGFSAYLHPLKDGLLMGLGQETDQGSDGVQVSVFDVSDPDHPALDARRYYPSSYSSAEQDPHAFLWWPAAGTVIIPVQLSDETGGGFSGDLVFRVGSTGTLTEVGRISQPAQQPPAGPQPMAGGAATAPRPAAGVMMVPLGGPGIERALIVGGLIYTVSDSGVMASDLTSLQQVAWLPYPATP